MLKKNRVGKSNIYVSVLSLGCMSLGTDEHRAKEIIDIALDKGINHLDTADLYDFGKNEQIIGEAIKRRRDQVILTTKVGNHFDRSGQKKDWFWDPSKRYIESALKESLQRLQTDYIDIYLLHGGTIEDPIDEVIETFERMKEAGYIRTYGISSIRPNVMKEYVRKSNIDVVMMQYNMLDRRPEEWLSYLSEHDISVFARGPLAKGMLTEQALTYISEKGADGYLEYDFEQLKQTILRLQTMNPSLSKLAFQYLMYHSTVASIVFGASSKDQLIENIHSYSEPLMSQEIYEQIQHITKFFPYTMHR